MNELVDFRGVRHGNRNRANGAAQGNRKSIVVLSVRAELLQMEIIRPIACLGPRGDLCRKASR